MTNGENLLAIDTSTENAGIGVLAGERTVELRWTSGREQTTSVLDQIDRCLSLAGIRANDLSAIAIAIGPGMFNGLRVGMSLAKGFAISLGVPIVGIPTLDIAAQPWLGLGRDVIAVVTAGRGRIVWSRYGVGSKTAPENATVEELIDAVRLDSAVIVAGEVPEPATEVISGIGVLVRAGIAAARSPIVLGQLAQRRLRAGEQDDLVALEPVYVHGRSVVTQR